MRGKRDVVEPARLLSVQELANRVCSFGLHAGRATCHARASRLRGRLMNEQWLQEYVLLTLRIDKLIQQLSKNRFVDHYYGPAEWKVAVVAEPAWPVLALLRTAGVLADTLSAQQFAASPAAYLSKQVLALETVCRRLNGETFSLEEEV